MRAKGAGCFATLNTNITLRLKCTQDLWSRALSNRNLKIRGDNHKFVELSLTIHLFT